MYLGVILAGVGGALIYWTWTMVIFGFGMLGLSVRARREDIALKQEFGEEWIEYAKQVPAWFPKI
jgi:protein-S-isoprenylcysteine O-methyltransferase Ste14